MKTHQQMIEDLTESYVAMLDENQDEQEWLENEVLTRLKTKSRGIKFNDLCGAIEDVIKKSFCQEVPWISESHPFRAYVDSAAFEEYLSDVQYDLMRHCIILERALALSAAANPTYERDCFGEWVS
ncbi:hypothetical protein [Pectobacterium carotovorum]|uniref:hypothetical protein n=1 Tax=Pectobacterium carotovorum TaxID=554 RepID=UPI000D7274BC|nr:hypothetical protein [Pectobacterium carotovorum]PXB01165.1 hypothetical protein DMB41_16350 [Pectobacterium carotovorum subsp. carotovorum]